MKSLILYWFKVKTGGAARRVLSGHFDNKTVQEILTVYWKKYREFKPKISSMPTMGGSIMVNLAAMSAAFYRELLERGQSEESATHLFYEIAWEVYKKMGILSWRIAGLGTHDGYERLLKATRLFRAFPFNSPSYLWKDIETINTVVGFNCLKCPVAEYFQSLELSKFCTETWCKLDYPLAELWHAKLQRTGSIAGGAAVCDFRWTVYEHLK